MITLNTERGLVKIERWEDIEELAGFVVDVDPKNVKLVNIIGHYRLPDLVKCGLSSCHQKHFRGYIITAKNESTNEMAITNIGHQCGSTHFKVDFDTLSRKYDRDTANQERRETLIAAKNKTQTWQEEIDKLKSSKRGAGWLKKQVDGFLHPRDGLPKNILSKIHNMIKMQTPIITKERMADEDEIEILKQSGELPKDFKGKEYVISEDAGYLDGFAVLYPEHNIRELLVKDIQYVVSHVAEMDIENATEHELRVWSKKVAEIDIKLIRCQGIINDGIRFFRAENIAQLAEITENPKDENIVMKIARKYR